MFKKKISLKMNATVNERAREEIRTPKNSNMSFIQRRDRYEEIYRSNGKIT